MARFHMSMVLFFTMAVFWKYMDFAWFTRKNKDFLQVQGEQCHTLYNVIQNLDKSLKAMEALSKKVLNKNQCINLFQTFIRAMKGIDKMLSSATKDLKFQSIFEELCFLQRKVEIVGRNCLDQDRWCHSAVYQIQNKETFRELLLDLKCCYDTTCEIYLLCLPNQSNNILRIQFDATSYKQVLEDSQDLKTRLQLVPLGEDYEIAQHLLLRLRNLDRVDGGDLDALVLPNNFNTPNLIENIGGGNNVQVYYSKWLGLACATKVLKGDSSFLINSQNEAGISEDNLSLFKSCLKEVGILAGLSHPNLVQFMGCGINEKCHENFPEVKIGDICLVMERMETSLSTILEKTKEPLPYHVALDIMHQIAKGVLYLHDMQVAHLDLKPENVLSSRISIEDPCRIFKLTDYGTSMLRVCSNPKDPKPSEYTIGTTKYRAPEMTKGGETPMYPFQADVWSFAMICSKVLSRNDPYFDLKQSKGGNRNTSLRPSLPKDCEGLTNLIQECWSEDPLQRPTFSNICERLTSLKKTFLKGTFEDSKSGVDHVLKVDEPISPPKEIPVVLDHNQLSKAKRLLKKNYIGIIGMGGIGKTTLAKAIFNDVTVKAAYNASDFVVCKDYQSSYDILCKILPKLGKDKKPKNLGDAQDMMKLLLDEKKVLLILDDIKDDFQVHDIVPSNVLKASKGSTIIITTRNWYTIKSFVGNEGKLDVELLNDEAATTLFTTHLSWCVPLLPPAFAELCKRVVKACNGLPLSLKVMGSFLHNKERLRSWERALQVMARGRGLDGDEEIWNTLRISFDGLNNDVERGMFLDVACFFCRDVYPSSVSKATILTLWSQNGILPIDELERLIDMSLLKVSEDGNILEMHDQLRDMGRMISKGIRVCRASMIPEIGFSSEDIKVLQGISLQGNMSHYLPKIEEGQSLDFANLRVLILVSALDNPQAHVDNLDLILRIALQCSKLEAIILEACFGFSDALQVDTAVTLRSKILEVCTTCPSLKILDIKGLVLLDEMQIKFASKQTLLRLNLSFCSHLAALPKEVGNLSSLTILDLRGCSSLEALPKEMGNLSSLTTLVLKRCYKLVTLPKEVGNLSSLSTLDLGDCSRLEALPKEVRNLSSLTTLALSGCSSLEALPEEVGNLSSLTTLNLSDCSRLEALPKEVGNLSSLKTLDLSGCSSLEALSEEVGNLSCLRTLDMSSCSRLEALPKEVGNLSSLTTLDLSGCSRLEALLKEVGNLSSLNTLDMSSCSRLEALPKEVGNLTSLTTLDLSGCSSLKALPEEVGNLSSLTTFDLNGCSKLEALPKEVGNLSCLTTLVLKRCYILTALLEEVGNLSSLNTLDLSGCSSLKALPEEVGNLSSLTILALSGCLSLEALTKEVRNLFSLTILKLGGCSSLEALPEEVGNLSSLTTLDLSGCSRLEAFPKEVGNLSSLTTLVLNGCSRLEALPKEVGNLSCLTTLVLKRCYKLIALPKEVGNLSSLTTLDLSGCSSLKALPEEVGNLSSLITLNMSGCFSLKALPEEVGNLSSLITLNISGCSSLKALPEEVGNLSSLITLNMSGCFSLEILPKEVRNLSSLTILKLGGCSNLEALPEEVGNLSFLTTLDLSGCLRLEALPKEVGNLSFLITLVLKRCYKLVTLPKEVGNLTSLTTFDLSGCSRLEALPKEVRNLSSLTTLVLKRCYKLLTLPKEVGNLSSLTTLNLSDCSSLKTLPKEVGNLTFLTTLVLKRCYKLVTLSKEVGNLSSLTTLALSGCSSLEALPEEVGNLSSLTTLNLSDCSRLEALPKEMWNLTSLTTLVLKKCYKLVTLPKEVGNLSFLTNLDLNGCWRLLAMAMEVGNLTSLTTLDLSGCSCLEALPKEVGNLSSLTTLDLSRCSRLEALPKEVGNLCALTTLNLSDCSSLEALPKEVGNLSSLTTLELGVCSKLEALPKEVRNLSSLTILELGVCLRLEALPKEVGDLSS